MYQKVMKDILFFFFFFFFFFVLFKILIICKGNLLYVISIYNN